MAVTTDQIRDQINLSFSRLNPKQKLMLFIGLAVGLALIFIVFIWTASPNYDILFTNLSQKDAGNILEKLKEKNVNYKLENGGGTILVPTNSVYELRLDFAQSGLPESSGVGYEIFDQNNLGMTDFIQQINYRRALEGELARTIDKIEAVEGSRVHIVIPKDALFKEDQNPPTASVVLKLRSSGTPSPGTIQGIAHLVASSVEGLNTENISILDTRGRVLSDNRNPDNLVSLSGTQLEFAKKVENYLAQKAQTMLDQVLGPGNAVVRVNADLDFTQVEKNIEHYDPDNTAIRSEEINEESTPLLSDNSNNTENSLPSSERSTTVTNYEVNRTVQHVVEGVGNVKRLSVAVMVNNKKEVITGDNGEKQVKYLPRSEEEMETLTQLVRTAVGIETERNDQVSVVNVNFTNPTSEEEFLKVDEPTMWDNWHDIIEKVFLVLAVIASMIIMRSLFGQVKKRNEEIQEQVKSLEKGLKYAELPGGRPSNQFNEYNRQALQEGYDEQIFEAENFFKNVSKSSPMNEKMREYIRANPEESARLIKVWLLEDEEGRN